MAFFSGSYTVGTGGDYSKWSDVCTALGTNTANGDVTFTQISTITETGEVSLSSAFNLNGYTLRCLGNFGTTSGNFNSSYKIIDSRTNQGNFFYPVVNGTGTQIYSGLILLGSYFKTQPGNTASTTIIYQDCMASGIGWIDGNNGGYGFYFNNAYKNVRMSNCVVYGDNVTTGGIRIQECASATVENCNVYQAVAWNFYIDDTANGKVSLRNNISMDGGDSYVGLEYTVYSGCASSNTVGNSGLTNLTTAIWSSVDPANTGFMRLASSNGLGYSGVLTLLTENNHGIARNARPHGGYYSIGIDEATWQPPVDGYSKKVAGVTTYSKINGVSKANITKLNGVPR